MNEGNMKIKIFLMQAVDLLFLITVLFVGVYAIFYSENPALIGLAALIGLFLVNKLGSFTTKKIATMRVNMEIQQRQLKKKK